jgi:signal peptidase I
MGARSWVILVVAIVLMGLALFVVDFPRAESDDMAPGIRRGDVLLACRVCGRPQRGDVVMFSSPDGQKALMLRRVLAVPGDQVEMRAGQLLVNGQPLDDGEPSTLALAGVDPISQAPRKFVARSEKSGEHAYRVIADADVRTVGERPGAKLDDSYFVLADRRTLARDSRDYGPVPSAKVRSIVLRVLSAGDHDKSRTKRLR